MMVLTENIYESFAHISINSALYGVVNRGDTALYLEKDIEEPFGISIKILPMGDEHVVADGSVAMIHGFLEGWNVLR